MTFLRKATSGDYYITRKNKRNWWLVKVYDNKGYISAVSISLNRVVMPKNLIGKRIRFKLEIVEEK